MTNLTVILHLLTDEVQEIVRRGERFSIGLEQKLLINTSAVFKRTGFTVISGRLPAAVYFCHKGKKSSTDYPHWPLTPIPKPEKIMLPYYRDENSQTWSDEYSMFLFTKQKIDRIFC